jgi:eukaryotic-like serine/threonine-protein kinase
MTAAARTLVGRYQLLEPLGQGGMGRVWRGVDTKLGRAVAVKEVVAVGGLTEADLEELGARAQREARAAARLNHPNVVRVYDIVADTVPCIVMEYVPSRSLFQVVAADGPLAPARAARYGLDVLAALTAAHSVGVLHRDIKPSNVLITAEDRVMLTDFGLATIVGDPAVTRSGVLIGTPSFMAPERAADSDVGPEADLWSLGATLYFAVEGRSPYERPSMLATLSALANEEAPFSAAAGPLWPVLEGLLRRDPRDRLSVAQARSRLRDVAFSPRVAATRVPAPAALPVSVPTVPARTGTGQAFRRRVGWTVAILSLFAVLLVWLLPRALEPGFGSTAGPTAPAATGPTSAATEPTPTLSPSPSPGPGDTAPVLPAGWHMYTDSTGFSVAVPASWTVSRRGSIVYFSEPNGRRLLGIDQTDHPQPDPVADWLGKEAYRVSRGDFPSYQRVRLEAVEYFLKAADWEFTYVQDGVRLHVNNRGFITSPTQAYGMWWSTPDSQWAASLPDLMLIQASFRPAD